MQPAEGIRRVRKLLTDRAQAVVSQHYTAYSFTLKKLVKSLYGKIPYEGKIGYESENMRHCRTIGRGSGGMLSGIYGKTRTCRN